MSENSKILKNSGILYIRLLITSIASLFIARIVLQSLGASDFGLYSVVGSIVVMLNILNTTMVSTSFRYIAFEMGKGDQGNVNQVFNISLFIHICLALVVVLFAETAGRFYIHHYLNVSNDRIADAMFVFRFSVLATVFSIFSIPFQGLLTAHENFSIRSSIEVIAVLLRLVAAIIIVYYSGSKLRLYAILILGATAVPAVLYILYCLKKYASAVYWNFQHDINKYKEMIGFSSWIMLGAGACMGQAQGTALIINSFFGTILNASLGIASQVNSIVLAFAQNLGQAAIPQITKSYSSNNLNRTMQLVCYISKYSFFLMLLPALPILLEIDFILKLWLGTVPQYTGVFCKLMIVNALLETMNSGLPATVQASGKIKYFQIFLSATSLLSLPVAYLLFKFGCPPFAILAVYIVTTLINLVIWQVLLKKLINFNVKYFIEISYLKILYVSAIVSPLFLIQNLFHESLTRFILLSAFSVIYFLITVYFVGLEKKEKELIGATIGNIKFLQLKPGSANG